LVARIGPDEIYNLAAPSVVGASWGNPPATVGLMVGSVVNLLDALVTESPQTRYFQASSSEIFRGTGSSPQNEQTPPHPTSPYGVAKLAGHSLVAAYREHHGLHANSGILYNHESPRRPTDFVPAKIVNGAVQIKLGNQNELALGDLTAKRDWGFAGDFVDAMWQMLQQDAPGDYVIATGVQHTVKDLVDAAFSLVDLDPDEYVRSDPSFVRVGDEADLVGDPALIAEKVGWSASTSFDELVRIMVDGFTAKAESGKNAAGSTSA
jgi:GDPmannose 4,6-dehydratase